MKRLFLFLSICLLTILPLHVLAVSYGGIGGRPAYPRADNPRTDDIFVHTLEPGTTQDEGILVLNNTEEQKRMYVYSTDSVPSTDGGFACEQLAQSRKKIEERRKDVGSWITFGIPQSTPAVATDAPDSDRDGLTDTQEQEYQTDPQERDTDADGFLDGTEVAFGYNPRGDGLLPDTPTDTPTAPAEDTSETNPPAPDSDDDNDGLTYVQELEYGTNPNLADTDNDGFSDSAEIEGDFDPLQPVLVTLEPHTNIFVPFTIAVPDTASIGEHNGCIAIQEATDTSSQSEAGINISTRTALRVAITIPGDIVRRLEIVGLDVAPGEKGGAVLHPVVKNTGNVSVDATISLVTKNMWGQIVAEHGGTYPILRDDTGEWHFTVEPQFWGGRYTTRLGASYYDDPDTELGQTGTHQVIIPGPTVAYYLWPSIAAAAIYGSGVVLLGLGVGTTIFHRRRLRWIRTKWQSYTVQSGDSLRSIAEQRHISWKLLAKANALEPPYELRPGTRITVPPTDA